METRKLYYENSNLREFSAVVTGCTQTEGGYLVTLDATAFYPEGGGQACDLGMLGDARVLDVQEQGGAVVHLCDRPLEPGRTIRGKLDWQRRLDLMQQHSGEHILSGLIHAQFGYHNVGFHVGKDVMEVDFDGPLDAQELAQLEQEANEAIWMDLPVLCGIPGPQELETLSYRSKKALSWPVRIVHIPGFDRCACCGVHVTHTGQIGLIKVISCIKFHQGVRLELVCGKRAYDYLCRVQEQNRQISQLLSAKPLETAPAVRRLSDQLAGEKLRSAALEKQLFRSIAENYVNCADAVHFAEGLSPAAVRELADAIVQRCSGTVAVFSADGDKHNFCLLRKDGDVKALGDALCRELAGRGGGKPGSYQGSLTATREEILSFWARRQGVDNYGICSANGFNKSASPTP